MLYEHDETRKEAVLFIHRNFMQNVKNSTISEVEDLHCGNNIIIGHTNVKVFVDGKDAYFQILGEAK